MCQICPFRGPISYFVWEPRCTFTSLQFTTSDTIIWLLICLICKVRTDRSVSFYEEDDSPNIKCLRDILLTYSFYNFDLGYCQVSSSFKLNMCASSLINMFMLYYKQFDHMWHLCFIDHWKTLSFRSDVIYVTCPIWYYQAYLIHYHLIFHLSKKTVHWCDMIMVPLSILLWKPFLLKYSLCNLTPILYFRGFSLISKWKFVYVELNCRVWAISFHQYCLLWEMNQKHFGALWRWWNDLDQTLTVTKMECTLSFLHYQRFSLSSLLFPPLRSLVASPLSF